MIEKHLLICRQRRKSFTFAIKIQPGSLKRIVAILKKELLLLLLIALFLVLLAVNPLSASTYLSYINYEMLGILFVMMILTEALRQSGFFSFLANNLISKFTKKRHITLSLTIFSALLATFLTNDISLFIVLPIALQLRNHFGKKFWLLVVYILIAVNAGSALTPIGNPQNIIIWRKWDIDFTVFVMRMLPAVIIMLALLAAFVIFSFKNEAIDTHESVTYKQNKPLFWLSAILLVAFVTTVELNKEEIMFAAVPLIYLLVDRQLFKNVDWGILLIFLFIFLDFNQIANMSIFSGLQNLVSNGDGTFISGILLSQIISNVPATVVLTNFNVNWQALALGVNTGAQGIIIGSLANLIGVRLTREPGLTLRYHIIGIPFLLVSAFLIWLLVL